MEQDVELKKEQRPSPANSLLALPDHLLDKAGREMTLLLATHHLSLKQHLQKFNPAGMQLSTWIAAAIPP